MTEFKTCQACGYVRQAPDETPKWKRPKCQKAYNKTASTDHQYIKRSYSSDSSPILLFQRAIFFVFKAFFMVGGGLWGIAGAGYIIEDILKINSSAGPLIPQIKTGC